MFCNQSADKTCFLFITFYLYSIQTILFIFTSESLFLKRLLVSSILLYTVCYLGTFRNLCFNLTNFCRDNKPKALFFVFQCLSIIFFVISFIYFLGKDEFDVNNTDHDICTGFVMFNLILFIVCKWYNTSINNTSTVLPVIELSLKNFKEKLKGKIINIKHECKKDLEELNNIEESLTLDDCSICLNTYFEQSKTVNELNINEEEKKSEELVIIIKDKFSVNKNEIVVLNCTHKFHYECLNKCFINNIINCPLCRRQYID